MLALGDFALVREQQRARWEVDPLKAFEEWRRTMKASNRYPFSDRSIQQHKAMWTAFLNHLEHHHQTIQTVQPDGIEAFLKRLKGRPVKKNDRSRLPLAPGDDTPASYSTINRYTKLLAETFEHLGELGVRRGNPVAAVARIYTKPEAPPGVEFLNGEQEAALLAHIEAMPSTDWKDERDRALLFLLLASGPTVGELARLRIDDIQLGDYKPVVQLSSHDLTHAHGAPIAEFAVRALTAWRNRRRQAFEAYERLWQEADAALKVVLREEGKTVPPERIAPAPPGHGNAIPGSLLFPSNALKGEQLEASVIYNVVRDALDAIRFPGKIRGPQTLRNTFARRQLYHDADPAEVSRWLGLVSDKTVNRILRSLPGTKKSAVT